jgi:hypothetical protein
MIQRHKIHRQQWESSTPPVRHLQLAPRHPGTAGQASNLASQQEKSPRASRLEASRSATTAQLELRTRPKKDIIV